MIISHSPHPPPLPELLNLSKNSLSSTYSKSKIPGSLSSPSKAYLALFLLTLLLLILATVIFSLISSVYLLLLLFLTPNTFAASTSNRQRLITTCSKFLIVYSASLILISTTLNLSTLFTDIPTSTRSIFEFVGFNFLDSSTPKYTIIIPHVAVFFTSSNLLSLWKKLLHRQHQIRNPKNAKLVTKVSLVIFCLSLTGSATINPSLLCLPFFLYESVLLAVWAFAPSRANKFISAEVLRVLSAYSGLYIFLSYIWQFEDVNNVLQSSKWGKDLMEVSFGLVFFKVSEPCGIYKGNF